MKRWIYLLITGMLISVSAYAKSTMNFTITGLEDPALKNAITRLQIEAKSTTTMTVKAAHDLYQDGAENIRQAIEPYGFFKANIQPVRLSRSNGNWNAYYKVTPGPVLKITQVNLKLEGNGKADPKIKKAFKRFSIKKGDNFNSPNYKKAVQKLLLAAQKRGYIKARFTHNKVYVNVVPYTCVMNITMNTGPRYYFGLTTFEKNPLDNKFLARFPKYKAGEPFSTDKLMKLQNDLDGAGYYNTVSVIPEIKKAKNKRVPVHVDLTPKKRKLYQIGLGYGTLSGPRISGGVHWRWTNRWGDKFNTNFNLSQVDKNIEAQYLIPAKNPANDQYSISAGLFTLSPRHGKAFVKKLGVGYISQRGKWQRNIGLNYIIERFRVEKHTAFQHARMLTPNLSYTWLSTRKTIQVQSGARFEFLLRGAYKGLGSTVSFVQPEIRAKLIHTFFKDNRFVLRGDVGYTVVKDISKLPLSVRYYTGGAQTIRGFGEQSIGPGRYLTVASAEYQRRVVGNWYAAIFYDAGNAFDNFDHYKSNLRRGAGIGVVWQSPIGDVSLYLAKAISKKGKPNRIILSLGPSL